MIDTAANLVLRGAGSVLEERDRSVNFLCQLDNLAFKGRKLIHQGIRQCPQRNEVLFRYY